MRVVIQLCEDPPEYLAKSNPPTAFRTSKNIEGAEVWTDPAAARAWCETRLDETQTAKIIQLDAPIEVAPPTQAKVLETATKIKLKKAK